MTREEDWVCLGVILRPHGVQGLVRIRPFTADPEAVAAYGPVTDRATGRRFGVAVTGLSGNGVMARIEGIADRNGAEALRGTELWVRREALPETGEEEYYHHDMIGLRAETMDGARLGEVAGIENHGAGDLLEVSFARGVSVLVPFTKACVPVVDLGGGRVVIDAPPGLLDESDERRNLEPGGRQEERKEKE